MTFNIRGAPEGDGVNAWENRAELNTRTIQRYAPDLIGFQEAQEENLAFYTAHLAGYACTRGPRANSERRLLFNAIFWNEEKLELIEAGGFYLSSTPEKWSLGWDSARVRAVTWARLQLKEEQLPFLHLNTHLDHIGHKARIEGSRLIAEQLSTLWGNDALPVILTGDFNSPPKSSIDADGETPYSIFRTRGFNDAYEMRKVDDQPENTFHGFQGADFKVRGAPLLQRIDWILCLSEGAPSVEARNYAVVQDAEPPLYPSDHYPVLATIEIGAA